MAFTFPEALKIEKRLIAVENPDENTGEDTAQDGTDDLDRHSCRAQCYAVNDQLRIEQDRGHHESSKPVIPHSLPGKRSCDRDRPVHTQR